tara:strand:- start:4693 stop:6168 length:1476 start_codon:yes stop_codon:yes gene_type:complete
MNSQLNVFNSLSGQKDVFRPMTPPHVGLYVCGPTVYSKVHLGNCRTFISFDLIYRYLQHLGYKVRYVRNITDAGHLENDADQGEDRISKKARLEKIEPMEVVQRYTVDFHSTMSLFNAKPPNIEPTATGHIVEQIELIKELVKNDFAYEINGSVYFDVLKYNQTHHYGILSKRNIEDLIHNTRELDGQSDKKNPQDFALWKKAEPEHIMRWPSPWGDGFPGWHLECTVMSTKYLGQQFDIHGGGMDLKFPHHECEIAQATAASGKAPVTYWLHANMLTLNGKKMSKSTGNNLLPDEIFSGENSFFSKAYSPEVVRFFLLQAHYRSNVDISEEALLASEKGFLKLIEGYIALDKLKVSNKNDFSFENWKTNCYSAMNDDFNSPKLIAYLYEAIKFINTVKQGKAQIDKETKQELTSKLNVFIFDVLGLKIPQQNSNQEDNEKLKGTITLLLELRNKARQNKDFATADQIRSSLLTLGVEINDNQENSSFTLL